MKESEDRRQHDIERKVNTCVHHVGTYYKICKAGIEYPTVADFDPDAEQRNAYPCAPNRRECRTTCEKRQFPSLEDATEMVDAGKRAFREMIENLNNDICPTHKMKITKQQVGRCVYAKECGCRLYQGKIVKK